MKKRCEKLLILLVAFGLFGACNTCVHSFSVLSQKSSLCVCVFVQIVMCIWMWVLWYRFRCRYRDLVVFFSLSLSFLSLTTCFGILLCTLSQCQNASILLCTNAHTHAHTHITYKSSAAANWFYENGVSKWSMMCPSVSINKIKWNNKFLVLTFILPI